MRAPPMIRLVPPMVDQEDNTVHTTLASIIVIRQWYEALEVQALLQLGLHPNYYGSIEEQGRELDVEVPDPAPWK
jgi:hypothetical protein